MRITSNGTPVATLNVAINHRWRQGDAWKDDVGSIECAGFGEQAGSATSYLSKGSPVLVEGRLRFRRWETQDGHKRSKHDIVASNVQFLPHGSGAMPFTPESGEDGDEVPFGYTLSGCQTPPPISVRIEPITELLDSTPRRSQISL